MQGNKETIAHFLNNSNEQIIVPVYQRNYSWKQSNCGHLATHFLSSLDLNSSMDNLNLSSFLSILYV